jgi:hypothetical protein
MSHRADERRDAPDKSLMTHGNLEISAGRSSNITLGPAECTAVAGEDDVRPAVAPGTFFGHMTCGLQKKHKNNIRKGRDT